MIAIYPYDTLVGDVRMSVGSVVIDGKSLSTNYIDPDLPEIAFRDLEADHWEEAMIDVTVTAPAGELSGNATWAEPTAVVQIICSYSNSRRVVALPADTHSPGRWHGSVMLARDEWYGRATMRALATATVDEVAHRVIGSSEPWVLSFDDLPPSPVHGSLAVQWVDFPNDAEHGLKPFKNDPQHLRLDPEAPVLYLNSGFEGLEALLGDRKRRPHAEQALHDSTRANIAGDAWQAMFVTALEDVEIDPETGMPEWPTQEWRVVVLKTLFPRIYPHLGPEDALVEAVQARGSGESFSELLERLLPAAAMQVGTSAFLRRGIALLEKDAETKEVES
ncbi:MULTISPECIES: hypothetical protein [Micrococcaceae]|uniref:hypothetical protein n=1 Tax=Micrococcaceae TaxID=1268 RepID=UPI0006F40F9C|nr:hypothetical protein [Arthrobacter sp. Soil761]KRE65821.1 hypothetical protein ASG79_11915 [Arthrobacter sp. Soil761]